MEKLFTLSGDNRGSAFLHILTEIYAQNRVIMDMMLQLTSKGNEEKREEIKKYYSDFFNRQKREFQDHIRLFFGDINLNDILGDEKT